MTTQNTATYGDSEPFKEYLTQAEAAKLLGLKPSTLMTWRSRPPKGVRPPPYRKFGSAVRYPLFALLKWAEAQK